MDKCLGSELLQFHASMDRTATAQPDLESLLDKSLSPAFPKEKNPSFFSSLLPLVSILFLTVSCAQAIYNSLDDPSSLAFIVTAYSSVLLLLWCLRRLDNIPRGKAKKEAEEKRLKLAVFVLCLFLNAIFSYRVGGLLPLQLAVIVWAVAGVTAIAGCCMYFCYSDDSA